MVLLSVVSRHSSWRINRRTHAAALRTGRDDFAATCRRVSDVFLSKLHHTGVPRWYVVLLLPFALAPLLTHRDFDAPEPTPYDASAGTIAACGLRMLSVILQPTDPKAADYYLGRAFKLVEDILRECGTPAATLGADGAVSWGEGGWETLLSSSTIVGNPKSNRQIMDHGLICECARSVGRRIGH